MQQMRVLDIDNIARIGLMYLDGEAVRRALLERVSLDFDDINYDHEAFAAVKNSLTRLEKIDPELDITAIVWELWPSNPYIMMAAVCGNALPVEGFDNTAAAAEVRAAILEGQASARRREGDCVSHYYPIRDSKGDAVAALELLVNRRHRRDI